MSKGSSGSRRWISRRAIDTRPIVPMFDDNLPLWVRVLEAIAPLGCFAVAGFTIALVVYAWATDLFAGHLQ